ncbi:MAG: asparaginase [Candidatus Buchananbacteria bacterium]
MVIPRKKIILFICHQSASLRPQDWQEPMADLNIIADVEPVLLFTQPSADLTPQTWFRLAKEIYQRLNKAEGFIVLHGIDNILYTSSAVSFLLQNLNKSIIFAGVKSDQPDSRKIEIRANLINACQTATYKLPEVCLMFGNRLIRASQSVESNDASLNAFNAPLSGTLGRIDFSVRIYDKAVFNPKGKPKLFDSLNEKIQTITLSPLIDYKNLASQIADKEGIVVNANSYRNLPTELINFLSKKAADLPVVIWNQSFKDPLFLPKNIITIQNMTWPTTVTKFMWATGVAKNPKAVKELMAKNIAGEIIS